LLLVSHAIFFKRFPHLRPSLIETCRTILREWIVSFVFEGLRVEFRGFWRSLARQMTLTKYPFLLDQSHTGNIPERERAAEK